MLNSKEVSGVLAGTVAFHLPQGQAATPGKRGQQGGLWTTQIGFIGAVSLLPLPPGPGKAPGFQL